LLEENGHEVIEYTINNQVINEMSTLKKIQVAVETPWSLTEYRKLTAFLEESKPAIVHVHNFFPLFSPSIYYACKKKKIPVIQTLHNYRLLCPSAMFLRENKICEKCLGGSILNSVVHGCYRDSVSQTIPIAGMISLNKILNTWNKRVDKFIALTEFAKSKFVQGGLKEDKIVVKPNFINSTTNKVDINEKEKIILFVGRLSKEKGTNLLLEAWNLIENKHNYKLVIIGEGPEEERLKSEYNNEDIIFKGSLNSDEVLENMRKSRYLVVPSIWYEGFPMTIIESYSVGTPVLASNIGSLKEIIIDGKTGYKFEAGNVKEITFKLQTIINENDISYTRLLENTLANFKKNYTDKVNYENLIDIYNRAIKGD